MAEDRASVRNAADRRQVNTAAKRDRHRRENQRSDLQAVLTSPAGRRLLWRLLDHCKVFGSVMDASPSQVTYNSGRQDVGHFLMAEIAEADGAKFLLMMQESAASEKLENQITDAVHTAPAGAAVTQDTIDESSDDAHS